MPTYTAQTDRPLGPQITALQKGDTLFLPDFVWQGNVSITPPEAVTIKTAPFAAATIVGLVRITGAMGVVFDGIDVRWPTGAGSNQHMLRFTGGQGWKFINGSALGAHSYAALHLTGDARDFEIAYCEFGDMEKSNDTNQDHAIYASDTSGGVIHHCLMRDTPNGRGLKLGNSGGGADAGPDGLLVEFCTFLRNTGPSNVQFSYLARNNIVRYCVAVGSGSDNFTANSLSGTNNLVTNCVGWDAKTGKAITPSKNLAALAVVYADPKGYPQWGYLAGSVTPPPPPPPDPDPTPTPEDTELAALRARVADLTAQVDAGARDRAVLMDSLAQVTTERDAQRNVLKQIATLAGAY